MDYKKFSDDALRAGRRQLDREGERLQSQVDSARRSLNEALKRLDNWMSSNRALQQEMEERGML